MKKVDIKLGYSCNNDCIHCVVADNRDICSARGKSENLTTEEYKRELLDSRSRGYEVIVFTGGEPTLRNDLGHLMLYAHNLGYEIDVQTNGRRFCSREFTDALCSISRASYCIALHGFNEAIHDTITAVRGSFSETVAGIENLLRLGQFVVGKIVISKVNAPFILETCRLNSRLGIRNLTLTFPHALGNARKYFSRVVPTYSETVPELHKAIDFCRSEGISVNTEAFPFCLMRGYEEHVLELFFTDEQTELKQHGRDYALDWSKARLDNKAKFAGCAECCYDLICEGPWSEYPGWFGEGEFRPVRNERKYKKQELIELTRNRKQ